MCVSFVRHRRNCDASLCFVGCSPFAVGFHVSACHRSFSGLHVSVVFIVWLLAPCAWTGVFSRAFCLCTLGASTVWLRAVWFSLQTCGFIRPALVVAAPLDTAGCAHPFAVPNRTPSRRERTFAPTQVGTSVTECRKWHVREHTARIR